MGDPSRVRVSGPLEPYAQGFREELEALGYRPNTASAQLRLMAHLSRWLERSDLDVAAVTPDLVDAFLADRRAEGYTMWLSARGIAVLLGFLRRVGVVAAAPVVSSATAADELIGVFGSHLIGERGLAHATVTSHVSVARLFLFDRGVVGDVDSVALTAAQFTRFALVQTAQRKVGSAKFVACGLRAFLRFAYVTGGTDTQLDAAIPKVASWRLTGIPRSITRTEPTALLGSCDRRTRFGRRDYAVLVSMIVWVCVLERSRP